MKALDVACGDGAIGAVLKGLGAEVTGVELDPELAAAAREKLDRVFNADFLADPSVADGLGHVDLMAADFDAVIMNPPYKQAMEFVQRARKLMGRRTVAALLRLSFLESQKRRAFWQENPADVYVLSRRPSFTAGGTDSAAYAWFVWSREPGGRLSIL